MQLNPGDTVICYDYKVFDISHRIEDNRYLVGVNRSGDQRLFKKNGHYAGADKSRNAAKKVG